MSSSFATSSKWGDIGFNSEGEDINSKKYGSIHYPVITKKGAKIITPTIASNSMEIDVELLNETESRFLLEKVELKVIKRISSDGLNLQYGEWRLGTRSSRYNPYFEIDGESDLYVDAPEEFYLEPKSEALDGYVTLEVETTSNDVIYLFKFQLYFIDLSNNKKVVISSDKEYFIATE